MNEKEAVTSEPVSERESRAVVLLPVEQDDWSRDGVLFYWRIWLIQEGEEGQA